MTHAFIAIGSNLGDRSSNIERSLSALGTHPEITLVASSDAIETAPVGGPPDQDGYLNAAAELATTLAASDLLAVMLDIERTLGRDRAWEQRWGPRTIDLDLLIFGEHRIDEPGLIVPHPRMHERLFVLMPLAQIAPSLRIPGRDATVRQLVDSLHTHGVTS